MALADEFTFAMSKDSSEKKTYSVDEMMDRLRDGDREKRSEGELVTREDGSQVLRVKKRRRRTKQKKEEARKRQKRVKIIRALAIVTIPLVLGLGVLFLLAKYHSSDFAERVSATVWEKSGADSKISSLSPAGSKVTAKSLSLSWPDGNALEQLKMAELSGDLDIVSFATGRLRGEELNAEKGFLLVSGREGRKVAKPKGEPGDLPGFKRYSCDFFSFCFGNTKSPFRLDATKARFVPNEYSKQLYLTGGELSAGSWGVVPLKRGTLEFLNNTIRVLSLRFEEEERELVLSGALDLSDSIHSLSVEVESGTVGSLGGFGLEALISSEVDGATGTLVFRPWSIESHEMTLSCQPKFLKIVDFPFLKTLESLYINDNFDKLEFEMESDFEVVRGSEGVKVVGLDLREVGVLAVKGDVAITGERLGGTLKVGVPEFKRVALTSRQQKAFFEKGTLQGGFYWYEVELGGTVSSPEDSFRDYLEDSGRKKASSKDLFEQLTQ